MLHICLLLHIDVKRPILFAYVLSNTPGLLAITRSLDNYTPYHDVHMKLDVPTDDVCNVS